MIHVMCRPVPRDNGNSRPKIKQFFLLCKILLKIGSPYHTVV
jgi:hypothetical protein